MTVSARTGRAAAVAAAVGFGGLAVFQLALALGAPLGEAAWGGGSAHLSAGERIGSAVSAGFYCVATWVVLSRAGVVAARRRPGLLTGATRFFAVVFALSAVMNFTSPSSWENLLLGPVAVALAVLCSVVASAPDPGRPGGGAVATTPRSATASRGLTLR